MLNEVLLENVQTRHFFLILANLSFVSDLSLLLSFVSRLSLVCLFCCLFRFPLFSPRHCPTR
jgi:hypothetical protein